MVKITSGDELVDMLKKAEQIEMGFEDSSIWEGYIEVDDQDIRNLIFTLSSASHDHTKMVQSMIDMVEAESGEGSPPPEEGVQLQEHEGLGDHEPTPQVRPLAYNLYVDIQRALEESDRAMIKEGKKEEFRSYLERLLRDEKKHIDLLSRYVGFIQRIR